MSNMIDYLKWRGDLSFDAAPFCEIDAMILSELVYIRMDGLVPEGFDFGNVSLGYVCSRFLETQKPSNAIEKNVFDAAAAVVDSPRMSVIQPAGFVNDTDTEAQKQFAAVTYRLGEKDYFVAFRGTDNSLVGWKENLDLSYNEEIPSQKAAVHYLNEATKALKGKFIAGGHSKGGNLAVYAAAFSYKRASGRLTDIYNFDGPGFNDIVISKDRFRDISDRVRTFVPQNSLVGLLLRHHEPFTVIKSSKVSGLNEHQMLSWEVGPRQIERTDDLGNVGKALNENITEWIDSMTYDEKKQFIDIIYDLVDEFETVEDLSNPRNLALIMKAYSDMNDENKQKVSKVMDALSGTIRGNIREFFQNKEENVRDRLNSLKEQSLRRLR